MRPVAAVDPSGRSSVRSASGGASITFASPMLPNARNFAGTALAGAVVDGAAVVVGAAASSVHAAATSARATSTAAGTARWDRDGRREVGRIGAS